MLVISGNALLMALATRIVLICRPLSGARPAGSSSGGLAAVRHRDDETN
jgi:hypothetical protein